jgi:S-adenosylmethionine:tRNA ribosyltransferase-isomerase
MSLQLSDFDFDLPEDRIALRPAQPRDSARLMVVRPGHAIEDLHVHDLPGLLRTGDVLVFNDTRVIPARLSGVRTRDDSTVAVEATLHRRRAPDRWSAFMRPGKRLRPGDRVAFGQNGEIGATIQAKGEGGVDGLVVGAGGEVELVFDLAGPELDAAILAHGVMPLPPYIAAKRGEDDADRADYQTVYAANDGSVAAPTAGLHFTPELLAALKAKGVGSAFVTLHVGAGTFLPVKADAIEDHRMHAEYGEVSTQTADALNAARAAGGRIVCVGTTSLRLLESCLTPDGRYAPFAAETEIFIHPGKAVRAADALMTNFHLPRSTLLMLVAALSGLDTLQAAYAHAVADGYRFYSYGDGGLWFPALETPR